MRTAVRKATANHQPSGHLKVPAGQRATLPSRRAQQEGKEATKQGRSLRMHRPSLGQRRPKVSIRASGWLQNGRRSRDNCAELSGTISFDATKSGGGFLGIGAKPVAVSASDLDFMRDEDGDVHATWTKDQLKGMPEHQD